MAEYKGYGPDEESLKGDDTEFLATLQGWHDAAKNNRKNFDWQWYLYDNYYRGNHYIQYNKRTNQIVTPPRPKGQVRLVVNKIYSIVRSIRNFATSYRPKWSVVADSTSENTVNNNEKSGETLDFYFKHLKMPSKIKGVSNYVIKYGIGYFQYGWDEEAVGLDNQMGEVDVWIRDPFDVYLDPSGMETGDIQNCRFIDIAVSKPVQEIVNNSAYKKLTVEDVSGDTVRASSEFKQMLIQNQYSSNLGIDGDLKTTILHETLYKKRVPITSKSEKGEEITTYESQVWVASWITGHVLRNERTEFNKYNLIPIPSDDNPNEIYGEGYVKNLIPINKILNRLESQVVEYNNIVNRGRFVVDKESGITKITNETGEYIEKNPGSTVTALTPGGLSGDMDRQIGRMNQYLDDISGSTDAFRGNTPQGVTAGVAIESLKAQTANNLQDLKDNLENALAQLGEGILELIANKVIVARQIKSTGKDGKEKTFKIKGQVGVKPKEKLANDTYIIGNKNTVSVIIGSDLAYTKEGRIATLDKLLENKVIDPQTYLEHLEMGDIENIMKRTKQADFDSAMLENIKKNGMAGATGQPPMGQPTQPQGDSWLKLADDENKAMLGGENLPSTQNAPKEHTAIHVAFSQSPEAQNSDELVQILLTHIKGEEAMQGAPHAAGGQNA